MTNARREAHIHTGLGKHLQQLSVKFADDVIPRIVCISFKSAVSSNACLRPADFSGVHHQFHVYIHAFSLTGLIGWHSPADTS